MSSVDGPRGDLLLPAGADWRRVSPRLVTARLLLLTVPLLVLVVALVVLAVTPPPVAVTVAVGVVGAIALVAAALALARNARSWAYAERDEDLLVSHGVMLRRLVVVPYGRMQLVDVHVGPVDRLLGIATVKLHTAAATTDAEIPGLPPEEAARLRDRLSERGEARLAGL